MKRIIFIFVLILFPSFLEAQDNSLVLTNIVNAQINRQDEGSLIRAVITLNLVSGPAYKTDFIVTPEDVNVYKNGNAAAKLVIAKKYIRMAIKNYLQSVVIVPVDQGTQTVTKTQITDPGDTP